jgi:GT2 family glycosyltransferase
MKISVVIPFHNCGPYAYECLKSLSLALRDLPARQIDYEVLVVDDHGNPADVQTLCLAMERLGDERIRLIRPAANLGLSGARNFGIAASTGDYIWCVDADDFVEPQAVAALMVTLRDQRPDVALLDAIWNGPEGIFRMNAFAFEPCTLFELDARALASYLRTASFYAWRCIARRSLYDQLEYPDRMAMEDVATTPVLLARARTVWYEARPLIHYRQNSGSAMKNWTAQKSLDFIRASTLLRQRLAALPAASAREVQDALEMVAYNCLFWAIKDAIEHRIPDPAGTYRQVVEAFGQNAGAFRPCRVWRHFRHSHPRRLVGLLAICVGYRCTALLFRARQRLQRA